MQFHAVQPDTPTRDKKRVGRGGKRGTYSGRGLKGQKAHASGRIRPDIRDRIKKIPKRRGYGKNRSRGVNASAVKPVTVDTKVLGGVFKDGETVSPRTLRKHGLIGKSEEKGPVKILGKAPVGKKLTVSGCLLSKGAADSLARSGGSVEDSKKATA